MPSLEAYRKDLDYSYAPGLFPCMEAIKKRPELVRRVLLSSKLTQSDATMELTELCLQKNIRTETADRVLNRLSGKDNVFAAAVFQKEERMPQGNERHLVLHNPSDKGNLGTMLRSALGFGFKNIAIIRPAADYFDPHVVRSSMGAVFSLNIASFSSFDAYTSVFPRHSLFPFMLDGAVTPEEAARHAEVPYSLIMGNEGSGLPAAFASLGQAVKIPHSDEIDSLNLSIAAGIGMYIFSTLAS